eukprot:c24774_g1_i1 orf=657-2150(-)
MREMQRNAFLRSKFAKCVSGLQVIFALLVMFVIVSSVVGIYSTGVLFKQDDACGRRFGDAPSADQVATLLARVGELQVKVGKAMEDIQEEVGRRDRQGLRKRRLNQSGLLSDVLLNLGLMKSFLLRLKLSGMDSTRFVSVQKDSNLSMVELQGKTKDLTDPVPGGSPDEEKESDPLVDFFEIEEIRKYLRTKDNRHKRKNFLGSNGTIGVISHACVSMKSELEDYMGYDVGDYCKDDWPLAEKLMTHGCDPLPRRRCLARAPPLYQKPLPINESLWKIPDNRNVRWSNYACRNFQCLSNSTRRGFFKCSDCFNLVQHEAPRWVTNSTLAADFQIADVLSIKPGEIRIGLDFSVGVGTFAARMLEHNVTIVSATLNLGAPFNEMIALRGLVPLYISVNQRLPFFDNTLDILHSTLFLDGWIDLQFLDFVVFDWDRVLRPGGLLWIDRFFCEKQDLDDYLYMFLQLRYKKHKWVITPKLDKDGGEVYFSALLEKPPRPF